MQASFAGLLTLVVGVVLCFGGQRFFRFLMVLVGFAAGFVLGGMGVAATTRTPFLSGLGGWLAAIVVGLLLGGLSIPFYGAAVAILGGIVAYLVASGVMVYLGYGTGTLTQAVGIVAGAVAIVLVFLFKVHRLLVIAVTAAAGSGTILAGILILLGRLSFDAQTAFDPTAILRSSLLWLLLLVVLFLAGVGAQWNIRSRSAPAPSPAAVPPAASPVAVAPSVPASRPEAAPPSPPPEQPPAP